jgi:predicted glycosyltransferase
MDDVFSAQVLIDVTHPAHVVRYVPIAAESSSPGHDLLFVGREKEVTEQLLAGSRTTYIVVRSAGFQGGRLGQSRLAAELVRRTVSLMSTIRQTKPRVTLSSNLSGGIAGWLMRRPVIFDTVDGTAVGMHHLLAAPFATVITNLASLCEDLGRKNFAYRSFKALAWLHLTRFHQVKLRGSRCRSRRCTASAISTAG